jgi:hypothetical protein
MVCVNLPRFGFFRLLRGISYVLPDDEPFRAETCRGNKDGLRVAFTIARVVVISMCSLHCMNHV